MSDYKDGFQDGYKFAREEIMEKLAEIDIADDRTYNSRKNYTLNHLIERIKIYNEENFDYEILEIKIKD